MCADGDGYQTSMMSKDAPGFYSKYDPFLAVFPHANDHTGAGEQLAQYGLPAPDELASFETEVTNSMPIFEAPCADDLGRYNEAWGFNDFDFHDNLFASMDSLAPPEQAISQVSAPKATRGSTRNSFKRTSDVLDRHSGKKRAVCPVLGCRTSLSRESDVLRHIRTIHGSRERLLCDVPGCKKSFSRSDKLRSHKKREHGPRRTARTNC